MHYSLLTGVRFRASLGLLLIGGLIFALTSLRADDPVKAKKDAAPKAASEAKPAKKDSTSLKSKDADAAEEDPYAVPEEATPKELLEFIARVMPPPKRVKSREQLIAHFTKASAAANVAADRILAADADLETAVAAAQVKFQILGLQAQLGDEAAPKKIGELAEKLQKDKRPEIADVAATQLMSSRVEKLPELDADERKQLVDDLIAWLASGKIEGRRVGVALTVAQALESLDDLELAATAFDKTADVIAKSDDEKIAAYAEKLRGSARRSRLVGKPLEMTGETLEGKKFDWKAYRGKVVLVDFWATWCGPCIQELPNVKRNYKQYHDKGFEVVGVSLDDSLADVKAFIEDNEIPWTNLFSADEKAQGWDNPLATRYGIMGIPATILVDKTGKVVTMKARGRQLTAELEKLLGPADDKEASDEPEKAAPAPKRGSTKPSLDLKKK